jgi:serine/threonine protein phosphatase PrpC
MVADGAEMQLKTSKTAALFGPDHDAAAYAAQVMRDTRAGAEDAPPREILLKANSTLASQWQTIYGDLSAESLAKAEPALADELKPDPRRVRWALPVCVATVACVDLDANVLRFAHAGDTGLLLFMKDGSVSAPAMNQMRHHEENTLFFAQSLQLRQKAAHLADVLDDPRVKALNNALYHNYVDENGDTDLNVGVGVVNGLPQLEHYIQTAELDISEVSGILLCSDGFLWPAPLDESDDDRAARLKQMRERIERDGLQAYYQALRAAEAADSGRDQFPRFKIHDDATAVYLETSTGV